MKAFPSKELKFKLHDSQTETLQRLNRRTEKSERLTSAKTDKTFRGVIHGNEFKIISSAVGKGAFCVMTGVIEGDKGRVGVQIHKAFRILSGILLLLPILALLISVLKDSIDFSPFLILVTIGQILMIRFIIIELVFQQLSRDSLNRLRDVLDAEWLKN